MKKRPAVSPYPPPYRKKSPPRSASFPSLSSLINFSRTPRFRLVLVWLILLFAIVGIGINLYRLQIVQAEQLERKARQQQMFYLRPYIPRRPIIDRRGNVLATDHLVYTLYVHPKLFGISKEEMAQTLAPILERQSAEELLAIFNRRDSGILLSPNLPEDTARRIFNLSLDGLELLQQYSRLYPQQEVAAEVLGYVDFYEHRGRAGLEFSQEKLLERNPLTLRMSRTGSGGLMPDHVPEGFLNFDDLRLQITLDVRVQRAARLALKEKMTEFNAKRGAVVVMDVEDGSIVALVCEPTYDPNRYSEADMALFKNWAVTDLYEPGSTFKPINVAIALEENAIQPNDIFHDTGRIHVDRWPISNHDYLTKGPHGNINISEVLQYSSNVAMVKMMQKIPANTYYDWLKRLEISEKMNMDLEGEGKGQLKGREQFTRAAIEPATTAFGQGFSLTPLKLVQLHAALANGGKLVTPHLVKGLINSQGEFHWQPQRPHPKPVFSANTSKAVLEMMEDVVTDGSGQPSQVDGYRVGGKTGTAQKASPTGGYLANAKITSFVGIVPIEAPRYVILAVVDEPKGRDAFGSTVTAPIVQSVIETLVTLDKILPTQEEALADGN